MAVLGYLALSRTFVGLLHGESHAHGGEAVPAGTAAGIAALTGAFIVAGVMLALIPIRRGERWAVWTSLAMFGIVFTARMATDPRCLVVLDPHQHGCHTFMIAVVLGVVGLTLAGFGRS